MEAEVSVQCHTEAMDLMDMAFKHPIIHLPVYTRSMVGHSMVLYLAQAVAVSPGGEVVEESLVAGEDSVVGGGNAWGPRWNPGGSTKTFFPKADPPLLTLGSFGEECCKPKQSKRIRNRDYALKG